MNSCLYIGSVMHRRLSPRLPAFRYRAFWLLIDLDEAQLLGRTLRWFSYGRANLFSFRDRDHGDGSATPLRVQLARQLADAGIDAGGGRIRLLCMPRVLGYCFNPLSIYFCEDCAGRPTAVVYEVHNTFGDRHSYVFRLRGEGELAHQSCDKRFYVSPFLDMGLRYDFRVCGPGDRVSVGIRVGSDRGPVMNAALAGERRDLDDAALLRVFFAMPATTLKVMAAIHWEALKLWWKGIGLRPRTSPPASATVVDARPATVE